MTKLTEKQKRFCNEYLVDLNATQAAIRAGYSAKSASRIAIELLNKTHVRENIEKLMVNRQKRTEVTQDMVIKELAAVGFANGSDFAKVIEKIAIDESGNPLIDLETGEPKKYKSVDLVLTDDLSEEKKKALAGIKHGKYGIEVNTCDKVKALELLGRHLGMFTDKVQVEGSAVVQILDNVPRGDDNG